MTPGNHRSVIIIGAGIAGLSAGCYAQMHGYQSHIFEMHSLPGGLCTAWQRKGYTIDGCIHWLVGSSPGSPFYPLWEEVGALQDKEFLYAEEYTRYETEDGRTLRFPTNLDALEEHWLAFAPEDAALIREFVGAARRLIGFRQPLDRPPELYGPLDGMRLLRDMRPYMGLMRRWSSVSIADFAARIHNTALRDMLLRAWYPEFALFFLMTTLAWMHKHEAGYPIGGSLPLARSIEQRYRELGGAITYRAKVRRILVRNDRAVGVELEDGSRYEADAVISAADGHTTLFQMLEGRYVDKRIRRLYEMPLFPPLVCVSLGVRRTFEDVPHLIAGLDIPLKRPIRVGNREEQRMQVRPHHFDPTLAPPGKAVVMVLFNADYAWWRHLYETPEQYRAEKERIADQVVAALEERFPGLAAQVEMRDVATPMTYERYTGNWQASFEGWLLTPHNANVQMPRTLPGLKHFYMAGHWTMPGGGLPVALLTGRWAVQLMAAGK